MAAKTSKQAFLLLGILSASISMGESACPLFSLCLSFISMLCLSFISLKTLALSPQEWEYLALAIQKRSINTIHGLERLKAYENQRPKTLVA